VVHTALAQRWQVADASDRPRWRDVKLGDIAVLVPARTSLPHLEDALDAAGIRYRAEASSLVYRAREVRDLLTAARAADDPSDPLTLVAALRTPLFGCGDDDLWTWQQAGGRWNIFAPRPDTVPAGHPVRDAFSYLRRLHNDRTWLAPSEILERLAVDRRMLEVVVGSPGPVTSGGGYGSSSTRPAPGQRPTTAGCAPTSPGPSGKDRKPPASPRRCCPRPAPTRCGS